MARRSTAALGEASAPLFDDAETNSASVFSSERSLEQPALALPAELAPNARLRMDGRDLLRRLPESAVPAAFFDPQYRGVLDYLAYGNEGENRGQGRAGLPQMDGDAIAGFIGELDRVLIPSGHLFLWMDKFHLCTGFHDWLSGTSLETVDMITWDKDKIGMGYRSRRKSEHLVVLQKSPRKAKGVWKVHTIPDVWTERVPKQGGVHPKPVELQAALIEAVTNPGDLVVDPAAGTFSVLEACRRRGRAFLGCDVNG